MHVNNTLHAQAQIAAARLAGSSLSAAAQSGSRGSLAPPLRTGGPLAGPRALTDIAPPGRASGLHPGALSPGQIERIAGDIRIALDRPIRITDVPHPAPTGPGRRHHALTDLLKPLAPGGPSVSSGPEAPYGSCSEGKERRVRRDRSFVA